MFHGENPFSCIYPLYLRSKPALIPDLDQKSVSFPSGKEGKFRMAAMHLRNSFDG
jgi:hypothetical protein